jgi:hypothetical protein
LKVLKSIFHQKKPADINWMLLCDGFLFL